MPGQSEGPRHSTQLPLPSHWLPPTAHVLPTGVGLCEVVLSGLQTSSVHSLASSTGMQPPPAPPWPPTPPWTPRPPVPVTVPPPAPPAPVVVAAEVVSSSSGSTD